jgi:hypothetical protein
MRRIARSTSSLPGFWNNERVSALRSKRGVRSRASKKKNGNVPRKGRPPRRPTFSFLTLILAGFVVLDLERRESLVWPPEHL